MTSRKAICCWTTSIALGLSLLAGPMAGATTLSCNFGIELNDNNAVDADEFGVFAPGGEVAWGGGWNNILLRVTGTQGAPDAFNAASQFGNFITLADETGAPTAAQMTSTGVMYCAWTNVSAPNQGATGEAGLMQSFLALGDGFPDESLTISGLNTALGGSRYEVVLYSETNADRVGAFTITDGFRTVTVWKEDVAATDSDADDDGFMEWVPANGTSQATATVDGNCIRVTGLSGDAVTITVDEVNGGRMAISALQIIELPESSCPADLDGDGIVGINDFLAVLAGWGACP